MADMFGSPVDILTAGYTAPVYPLAAGSQWYSGTATPTGVLGKDGDYYLETDTGIVFKKAAGAWAAAYTPFNPATPIVGGIVFAGPVPGFVPGAGPFPNPPSFRSISSQDLLCLFRSLTVLGNYTIGSSQGDSEGVYLCNTAGGPLTLTLPDPAIYQNRPYTIKDLTGNANTNNITVQRSGTALIDGATSKVINTSFGVLRLFSTAAGWAVL